MKLLFERLLLLLSLLLKKFQVQYLLFNFANNGFGI